MKSTKLALSGLALLTVIGCGQNTPTFSFLPTENTFQQKGDEINNRIDVLWVIDNSGSMDTSQQNVANNFTAFISDFVTKGYDFQIAVTTTDAYLATFNSDPSLAEFRDGVSGSPTGHKIITPNTPDLINTFMGNILQGTSGYGDERGMQSLKEALNSSLNAGFLREDSFLAIIIVSDEDDFSHDTAAFRQGQYNYSGLHTPQSYLEYLETLTNSSGSTKRFSVNAIHIWDDQCLNDLNLTWSGRSKGIRYGELVDLAGGVKGSLCDDFATTLQDISVNIAQLSTQFFLNRDPDVSTIKVFIDQVEVTNDSTNGWTYSQDANSIVFHGDAIPPQGSTIHVAFDPVSLVE